MKLNIDEYEVHRELVKKTLSNRDVKDYKSVSSMYAATSACPIFVVYLFIGEVIGYNEWLMSRLHAMAEFYEYTEFEGYSEIDLNQFTKVYL